MTNVKCHQQHLTQDPTCPICEDGPRDLDHILSTCEIARLSCEKLLPTGQWDDLFKEPFNDFLVKNLNEKA